MKMCLNVICEVLAILAIGLVNISFVYLFVFEIQGPKNVTYRLICSYFVHRGGGGGGGGGGGRLERPISLNACGCQSPSSIFCKGIPYSLVLNHKKTIPDKTRFTPKMGFGC